MRKKFVQTLAAQQLDMSADIPANDMETEKEQTGREPPPQRNSQQSSSANESAPEVIEILDDDNDVELMMERHRKYHPRKYVNLQQPPSKIYYDQIEKPISPTPDREYHDVVGVEEEEDDDRQLVIDCVQAKEVNNNSTTATNENHTAVERDSNVEPAAPTPFRPFEMETSTAIATRADTDQQTQSSVAAATSATSGFDWHVPQNRAQVASFIPPELPRPPVQPREPMARPRPDTPAPRMMMERHRSSSYQLHSYRSHPYEPPETNQRRSTLEDRRSAATPHPRALEDRRSAAPPHPRAMENETRAGTAGEGSSSGKANKSAFTTPREITQQQNGNAMPPPPPLVPSTPGAVNNGAIAPRTPFQQFHNPFLQPLYHYQAYGSNVAPTAAQTLQTLERWFSAGLPAPHLLSPTDMQIYYRLLLNTMICQQNEQLYRNYPSMATTPGDAHYPPPQYGFAKPIPVSPNDVPPAVTASSATVAADPPANPRPIGFSQQQSSVIVRTSAAGYLPTTLPSTSADHTQQQKQKRQRSCKGSNSQSQPTPPLAIDRAATPAVGYSRPSSGALMPPPTMTFTSSNNNVPTLPTSTMQSPSRAGPPFTMLPPPSTMLPTPSTTPCPNVTSTTLPSSSATPPGRYAPASSNMPPPPFTPSPGSIPPPSNFPHTTITSQPTLMFHPHPPPSYQNSTNMPSSTTTSMPSHTGRMLPPASNQPPYGCGQSPSRVMPLNSMPPTSISYASSTTSSGTALSFGALPSSTSNNSPYNTPSHSPVRPAKLSTSNMHPPINHPPVGGMQSPSSASTTMHSPGSMSSSNYHRSASVTSSSTTMPPPSFVLSPASMPILSTHLTSIKISHATSTVTSTGQLSFSSNYAPTIMHIPSISSTMSPGSMAPPSNNPPYKMPSPTSTTTGNPTALSPGSMTPSSDHKATSFPSPTDSTPSPYRIACINLSPGSKPITITVSPNELSPTNSSSMPSPSFNSPSIMPSPTSTTAGTQTALSPGSMTSSDDHKATSFPSTTDRKSPPSCILSSPVSPTTSSSMSSRAFDSPAFMPSPTSTTTGSPTALSPSSMTASSDHKATSFPSPTDRTSPPSCILPSRVSPTTSSSIPPPSIDFPSTITSSAVTMPSTACVIIHNMPSSPTTSSKSSTPPPSSSTTVSPPAMVAQPYTQDSTLASMPSLEALLTSPTAPPPPRPASRTALIPISARRKSCYAPSTQSFTISPILSPPEPEPNPEPEPKKPKRTYNRRKNTTTSEEPLAPAAPRRRGRSASVAADHSPYASLPPLPPAPKPPPFAAPANDSLDASHIGPFLSHVRREMVSFLQHRRSDIITTMRIYMIGRTTFQEFLNEMRRHSITYRDFMHVGFIVMRRCGLERFTKAPPSEKDYKWTNPPQELVEYFGSIRPATCQFVADMFDFLLIVVDNLLQQYFEPMECFILTYVLGVEPKTEKKTRGKK